MEILCKGFPVEFSTYIKYCRELEFDQNPDYDYLRQLFRTLYRNQGYSYDLIFDWNLFKFEAMHDQQDQQEWIKWILELCKNFWTNWLQIMWAKNQKWLIDNLNNC